MKRAIYKYNLEITDYQEIKLPLGAQILSIQVQDGKPCLWALVNPNRRLQSRHIETYGTGQIVKEEKETALYHRGTYQMNGGDLVFHVFERI